MAIATGKVSVAILMGRLMSTEQVAKMGSLYPLHLLRYGRLHNHCLYIRPMLASKGALDTFRRQVLGSQKNERS